MYTKELNPLRQTKGRKVRVAVVAAAVAATGVGATVVGPLTGTSHAGSTWTR